MNTWQVTASGTLLVQAGQMVSMCRDVTIVPPTAMTDPQGRQPLKSK